MTTYLIQQGRHAIRLMHDQLDDYTILAKWLTDPIVLEYYEGRDNPFPLERVQQKYAPRLQRLQSTVPCFLLDTDKPIGYLQYYRLSSADCVAFDLATTACPFGMDLFIGESARWNRGMGDERGTDIRPVGWVVGEKLPGHKLTGWALALAQPPD
jgi:aminoglycoside 6'-N-acetyltransferase